MDTKKLRQKILDLAIHGRLVPQCPDDEPAALLLQRIREEKAHLIATGKIKRTRRKDDAEVGDAPFEVPESWVWCRLEEICSIKGGKRIPRGKTFAKGKTSHIYLRVTDMKNNTIIMSDLKYIDDDVYDVIKNYTINSSDLYLTIAGTIGAVGSIPKELDGMNLTENAAKLTNIGCYKEYLMYGLLSSSAQEHFISRFHQVAQPKLSIETASSTPIPLPPLEEQRRIVKEIEHWFKWIEQIEQGKAHLQDAVKAAKAKILDLAIHGKLVPQCHDDEHAEILLKRINPDAIVHHEAEMPEGWCECRLSDVLDIVMGQSPKGDSLNSIDGIEFHQGKICFSNVYLNPSTTFTNAPTKIAEPNSLLLCVRAPVGIVNITQRKICIGRGLCALKPKEGDIKFYFYLLQTLHDTFENKATGSTFKAISGDIIRNERIPLPPLQEQRRIVARIQQLFAQLDTITESL